jgi:hypothetical protein
MSRIVTDLWLDDERKPPTYSDCGLHWTWIKTANEAIEVLKTGRVEFASLDHDLCDKHYYIFEREVRGLQEVDLAVEGTGMTVLKWMEENNVWPSEGVRIHTMNTVRGPIMQEMVNKHYGKNFQYQYAGTHPVPVVWIDNF